MYRLGTIIKPIKDDKTGDANTVAAQTNKSNNPACRSQLPGLSAPAFSRRPDDRFSCGKQRASGLQYTPPQDGTSQGKPARVAAFIPAATDQEHGPACRMRTVNVAQSGPRSEAPSDVRLPRAKDFASSARSPGPSHFAPLTHPSASAGYPHTRRSSDPAPRRVPCPACRHPDAPNERRAVSTEDRPAFPSTPARS